MNKNISPDEDYWNDYDGLQHAKHQLLTNYLGGWFPILSSWKGRVLYIDCHAGRGRHEAGFEGSPILAMNTLLNHSAKSRILSSTEVNFFFFEKDEYNYQTLKEELASLGELPPNVTANPIRGNYENMLSKIIQRAKNHGMRSAPSFAFVDPFNYQMSMGLLNEFLALPQSELLINLMFRYINLNLKHESHEKNMNKLFGTDRWKVLRDIPDVRKRADKMLEIFSNQLNAKYVTTMWMYAKNGALKYLLLHATNHSRGRQLMKEALWRVTPDGSFAASEKHAPNQKILIQLEPDLRPLKNNLLNHFAEQDVQMKKLYSWLLDELYRRPHLHQAILEMHSDGQIDAIFEGKKIVFSKNPTICFPSKT